MKNLFLSLAFMLIGTIAFANTQSLEKQKTATIENSKDKFKVTYNLGNVTNFTETQISTLCDNLVNQIEDLKNADECTVTLTAEVNVGFGSVSVSVSYTAANCQTAMTKAGAALKSAVQQVKTMCESLGM